MTDIWLPDEVHGIKVVRVPIPRPAGKVPSMIPMGPVERFVTHSGENMPKWTHESLAVFAKTKNSRDLVYRFEWTDEECTKAMAGLVHQLKDVDPRRPAPHVSCGGGYIAQHRPFNFQGSALRADTGKGNPNMRCIQTECSTNTEGRTGVWDMQPSTHRPYVALLAWLIEHQGIPAHIPNDWPDNCSDGPGQGHVWASETNSRRLSKVWIREGGVYQHMEVSEGGNNHYDLLYWRRSKALADARALMGSGTPVETQPVDVPASGMAPFEPVPFKVDERVNRIQQALGFAGMAHDAKWGPNTQHILVDFQSRKGLPKTGKPDEQTLRALGL